MWESANCTIWGNRPYKSLMNSGVRGSQSTLSFDHLQEEPKNSLKIITFMAQCLLGKGHREITQGVKCTWDFQTSPLELLAELMSLRHDAGWDMWTPSIHLASSWCSALTELPLSEPGSLPRQLTSVPRCWGVWGDTMGSMWWSGLAVGWTQGSHLPHTVSVQRSLGP
jgi:hypothetical protein